MKNVLNKIKKWEEEYKKANDEYLKLKKEYDNKVKEYQKIVEIHNECEEKHKKLFHKPDKWIFEKINDTSIFTRSEYTNGYTIIKGTDKYPKINEPKRPEKEYYITTQYITCPVCDEKHYF